VPDTDLLRVLPKLAAGCTIRTEWAIIFPAAEDIATVTSGPEPKERQMSIQEIEAAALKLSEAERAALAERLLASLGGAHTPMDDPIYGLGTSPVVCDVSDGSTNHDTYLYSRPEQ
jgi:hypothetical protein